MTIVYLFLGLLGAIVLVAVAIRRFAPLLRDLEPHEEPLPMTPLQKRAWLGLVAAAVLGAAVVTIVWVRGATGFFEDPTTRLLVDGILLGGLVLYVVILRWARLSGGDMLVDERDLIILGHASRVQVAAILASLLVWAIALTEVYWDAKQIPLAFAYLIFLSSLFVNFLAMPIGVLLGYRWARLRGQG